MKKNVFILLLGILAVFFTGCEKTHPHPLMYFLSIVPQSESGENLCKDLLGDSSMGGGKSYIVPADLYEHKVVGEGLSGLNPLKVLVDDDGQMAIRLEFAKFGSVLSKIEYYLKCPAIFGDEEEHAIVSYWRSEGKSHIAVCYKATVDGKEVSVEDKQDRGSFITFVPNPRPQLSDK